MNLKIFAAVPIVALFACGPAPGRTATVTPPTSALPASAAARAQPGSTANRSLITPPVFRQSCLDLKPLQVGGWTAPPTPLHQPPPEIGAEARKLDLRGSVVIAAIIDAEGKVCDAQVVKGIARAMPSLFDEPARRSILATTFKPATLDGRPVAVVFYAVVKIDQTAPAAPGDIAR